MPKRIVPPGSELRWGKLILSWATGENYLSPGDPPIPLPNSFDEFVDLCNNQLGLALDIPPWMNAVVFVKPTKNALTLRLPPAEIVKSNEAEFQQPGATYTIPAFYQEFFGGPINLPQARISEFHALRIGDYSISMCM